MISESKWKQFLHESIYLDNGVVNIVPRHKAIEIFVKECLYPLVKERGYAWKHIEPKVISMMLHVMFMMWLGRKVDFPNLQRGYSIDHYETFIDSIETETWEKIWRQWGCLEDFSEDGYAYRFRYSLQNFLWNCLDLANSTMTQELQEEIDEREIFHDSLRNGPDASKGKEDPYLHDTSNKYEDRKWF